MSVLTRDPDQDFRDRDGLRWPVLLVGVFVALLMVAAGAVWWVQRQIDPPGDPGEQVAVTVDEGMSIDAIGQRLAELGVIGDARVFRFYARLNGAPSVQAGDYTLRKNESMGDALKALGEGPKVEHERLTLAEGLTLRQVAQVVGELPGRSADRFLEVARSGKVRSRYQPPGQNNLEGLMLPETYFIDTGSDEEAILRRLVDEFDALVTSLGIADSARRLNVTPYQAIVVASLVEREARVSKDRAPIARVIYNRLDLGMPLQIDATVQYALGEQKKVLLYSDLEIESPYNTYKYGGLPPGPIANPGRAALEAALNPASGSWLYFVLADNDGSHAFSTTLAEHNRQVAEAKRKGVL